MDGYDFNCRNDEEVLYSSSYTVDTLLEAFLQEIDIFLSTEKGSVLGYRYFGANTEEMLWKTSYTASAIGSTIGRQLEENCLAGRHFKWNAEFSISKGTSKDIGFLTVNIANKETLENLSSQQFIFK